MGKEHARQREQWGAMALRLKHDCHVQKERGMKLVVGYESDRNRGQAPEGFTCHCKDFGFFSE